MKAEVEHDALDPGSAQPQRAEAARTSYFVSDKHRDQQACAVKLGPNLADVP